MDLRCSFDQIIWNPDDQTVRFGAGCRMGEVLDFPKVDGTIVKAKIVDQVFFDKDGEKQNV